MCIQLISKLYKINMAEKTEIYELILFVSRIMKYVCIYINYIPTPRR